jgi:hypothetical protein
MLSILIFVVGSGTVLILLLFVIVVIGIRQEPPMEELGEQAPGLTAAFVRRLLGAYVRRPDSPSRLDQGGDGCVRRERDVTSSALKGLCKSEPLGPNATEPRCWGGEESYCRRTRWSK